METKKKVDVKEIMNRAKAKTEAVNKSTDKVQSKTASFRIVPGLTKYEFNGNILRNATTKNIIKFKTGRTKYQIMDDAGESRNLSNDDLRALLPDETKDVKPEKVKKEKAPKVEKVKKEKKEKGEKREIKNHHIPKPLPIDQLKPDAKKIMSFPEKSYNKVIKLHEAGYSKDEIIEITGKRNDVISKYLRPLLKGKK